ncbi:hypothetical protein GCM10010531_39360 [Blastococcus jejuensis]|uniref:Uncharacterized protein n=1 Tax=Blastococcus jejuensis TaxID=351224 RepID=A0ABP6PMT1_9ACTN
MTTGEVVQIIAVSVTAIGVLAALAIAVYGNRAADRRAAADRAAADRRAEADRASGQQADQHRLEIELLLRLAANLTRGGAQDPQEVARLGAEARALIAALGPDRVPMSYAEYAESTDELLTAMADTSKPLWLRQSIEALLQLQRLATEHRATT